MTRRSSGRTLSLPRWLPRLGVVMAGLAVWCWAQALLGGKAPATAAHGLGDALHELSAPANNWLNAHPSAADALLTASSLGIDALGLFILGATLWGQSVRPFVGAMVLFGLRQACQALVSLPPPEGMIWHSPGLPSLLVTYGLSHDLFFSGHTALAVFGSIELVRRNRRWLLAATALALFEVCAVLALRAHYTIDVFAGAVTALWVASIAPPLAAPIDAWLARWSHPPPAPKPPKRKPPPKPPRPEHSR